MSTTTLMRSSLGELARKYSLEIDVDSTFDEYALEYVAEVLKESADLDGSFDVDSFIAVLAGYLPQLEEVDREDVLSWIIATSEKMTISTGLDYQDTSYSSSVCKPAASLPPGLLHTDGRLTSENAVTTDSRSSQPAANSRQYCQGKVTTEKHRIVPSPPEQVESGNITEDERLLKEMFPEVPEDEIHKVYLSEAASVDRSVERLISISETSGAKEQQLKQTSGRVKAGYTRSNKPAHGDGRELKAAIISKYGYVDVASDSTSHKPVILQKDVNKKTRYRDNQVVSTKGERFTICSKKDLESDEMKETYINLKPLRHYRFH